MQSRSIDQTTIGDRSTASRQVRPASLKGRRMPRRRAGRSGAGRSRKPIERPNGYRVENRALHVVEEHAAFVRDLFRGSVVHNAVRRPIQGTSRAFRDMRIFYRVPFLSKLAYAMAPILSCPPDDVRPSASAARAID